MKRLYVMILVLSALCGIRAEAQRPVGDTVNIGGGDYYYSPRFDGAGSTYAYWPTIGSGGWVLDVAYAPSYYMTIRSFLQGQGQGMTDEQFLLSHPDLATVNTGRHITGQEFTTSDNVLVIGLAACPTIYIDSNHQLAPLPDYRLLPGGNVFGLVDTTLANRETEYLQLYIIGGGTPQLLAEGAWRWEYPHRYMRFPMTASHGPYTNDITYAPLFEVMFDTSVLIEGKTFMLAGTHNNNGAVWSQVEAGDTVYTTPRICWEHWPDTYSTTACGYGGTWWVRYDTLPWGCSVYPVHLNEMFLAINIFPILDTLFGTPCAAVTGLDTAGVDSVRATLMWSADARQHDWQVLYRPTGDTLDSGAVVTVAVPTVTLTGLVPGTEYSVAVRGRCDIDNYSPWSDTLLFAMPQDTTGIIDTTTIDTTQTQGIQRLGNLDMFTRIMPNPASEVVNVLSSYRLESIAVYDLTGRLLLEQPAEGISAMVKVSALPRGTYIMAIRILQGVATKKLVVVEGN